MTNSEITALTARVKMGDVWWHDGDSSIKRVRGVNLEWVELEDQPDQTEPAALLLDGTVVALKNETITAFVTLQPAVRHGS